jgi:hypothetical protein
MAITDHVGHHPHREDIPTDLARPHAIGLTEAERLGILLVPGVEVMEGNTHFNLLFVTNPNAYSDLKMLPALREAALQNAFAIWNHPGWKRTPQWDGLVAQAHAEKLFRGMELVNGPVFYPEAFPFVAEHGLTIFANSDVHAPIQTEYPKGGRPITLLAARTRDLHGVRDALDAGRTAAWMNGEVWGPREFLEGLWKRAIAIETPRLTLIPPQRAGGLQFRNNSAIPFQLRITKCPEWMYCSETEIGPLQTGFVAIKATEIAPRGRYHVELGAEITNLHAGPGVNITVTLPFEVEIQ